jgi:hypothetical protein
MRNGRGREAQTSGVIDDDYNRGAQASAEGVADHSTNGAGGGVLGESRQEHQQYEEQATTEARRH